MEKAIIQCGRDALRLEAEREQARSERDRALSELFQLRAAAGHVANELADIDLDATPELAEQARALRGLLGMDDAAVAKFACRESIKKIRAIGFRDTKVAAMDPSKLGEQGAVLINPTIASMQVGDRGWVAPWAVFQHEGLVWLYGHYPVRSVRSGVNEAQVKRRADGYCVWYSDDSDPARDTPSAGDVPVTTFWFGLPDEEAA
ncbi:hypothetical protein IU451_28755 [Nocardia cyriacigeorgica]|uniref:hypothetical protein n=1 Tax=Nocardia cyriacigeorgica TaxID=135487 RepID=UPI0018946B9D|nr:hypothetical protein [Nocardia cyriacigeorgica]MBF6326493.1 hypothetical protein [Nocardia cyriacigeorgica]